MIEEAPPMSHTIMTRQLSGQSLTMGDLRRWVLETADAADEARVGALATPGDPREFPSFVLSVTTTKASPPP
jgi:hypothetical protein